MEKQFIKERIDDKIREVETFVEELAQIKPLSLEEYKANFEKRAACERYAEKIPEALSDVAFLAIGYLGLAEPKSDKEAFEILAASKVISPQQANRLQDAKGMRNIIAHEYGKVNDEIVFEAIATELERDVQEFLKSITAKLEEKQKQETAKLCS